MNTGDIIHVNEYNRQGQIRYNEAKGEAINCPAFFMWFNTRGNLRTYGYVGKTERGYIWRKTKKEVFRELEAQMNIKIFSDHSTTI